MENLLDSWDRAQRAPEPVELAKRTGGQVAVDAITGREEFAKSGEMIREGLSLGEPEKRDLGELAGGLALGGLTGLSFVTPWGRAGRMTAGGLRVAGRELGQFAAGEVLESVPGVVSKSGKRLSDSLARGMADEINDTFARSGVSVASRDAVGGIFESLGELGRGGGFTYTPATGVSDYSAGYGVAVGKGYTAVVPLDEFDATDVVTYLSYRPTGTRFSVAELVADNPKNSLGAWIEPFEGVDHVWLDVSRVLASEEDALRVGGALNEIAIIDFAAAKRTDFGEGTFIDVGADYKPGGRLYDPSVVRDVSMPSDGAVSSGAAGIPVGRWSENPTAEELPLDVVRRFREFDRSSRQVGTDIEDLALQIRERGFDEPIILDVDPQGWAMVSDGNHRLAAAELLGLDSVPVRVVTRRSGKLVGGSGARLNVVAGLGEGKLLKPSEASPGLVSQTDASARRLPPGQVSGESAASPLPTQPYEGDTVLGAIMSPMQASRQFGATSKEGAQNIFDAMARRGQLSVVSPEDLKTAGMLEYLDALSVNLKAGVVDLSADYPTFRQFQPFMDELGLQKPKLISNKRGETFRPLLRAIEEGRYDEVLDDLAVQINNVFTLLDDDVFTLAFYPYMHNATVSGAARTGTPAEFLAPLSGILSAGAAPVEEADAVRAVFSWGQAATKVRGDKLVQVGGDLKQYRSAGQAYVQLVNNPDWLSNKVPGLATKTHVYSMLKLNPRMVRALVIDRVDTSARLGAFEMNAKSFPKEWAWQTETAKTTQGAELALGGFAERVVASVLGVPPSAVQENVWAVWRVLRDLRVGSGPSRQSGVERGGKSIEDFMAMGKMPKAHRELLEKNLAALESEVASGGAPSKYWEFHTPPGSSQRMLVPKTDMPVEGFLPADIRTPENVAALEGAIGNAEAIGKGLAVNAPWAPIALQLSVLGGVGGAVLGGGQKDA